jgi:hypothetical protein
MTDRWYTEENDHRSPVAVDESGGVVFPAGPQYTVNGKYYRREVRREGQIIPAEPGWYALCANWYFSDDNIEISRVPVIAWEVEEWGDCYIANSYVAGDCPVERLRSRPGCIPVFLCHPDRMPERDDAEEEARREALADREANRERRNRKAPAA